MACSRGNWKFIRGFDFWLRVEREAKFANRVIVDTYCTGLRCLVFSFCSSSSPGLRPLPLHNNYASHCIVIVTPSRTMNASVNDQASSKVDLVSAFNEIDVDGSRSISKEELLSHFNGKGGLSVSKEDFNVLFGMIDQDASKCLGSFFYMQSRIHKAPLTRGSFSSTITEKRCH